jgi:hypothetical protein
MITLNFKLSPSWNGETLKLDLSSVDETAFRYELFLGNIIFKDASYDFSALWEWIPVVDFAAALRIICNDLSHGTNECHFEFTEYDAEICFRCCNDGVVISTNYAPGEITVSVENLIATTEAFAKRMASELLTEFPQLAQNRSFAKLLPVMSGATSY